MVIYHHTIPVFVWWMLLVFGVGVALRFYMMLFRPELWLEWFVNRPYRLWGLRVIIEDPARFRKASHRYAVLPAVLALIGSAFVLFVIAYL